MPAELVAVVVGIAATVSWAWATTASSSSLRCRVGCRRPSIPDIGLIMDNWETVIGAAVGLVLIGFSVTTAGVRQYATKHNYRIDVNQELLAQGMSNVLVQRLPGRSSTTAASPRAPSTTGPAHARRSPSLAQAGFVILTLLLLAPIFSKLPEAVLGAIIIEAVTLGMMNVGEMKRLLLVKPYEFAAALAALLGVMTFGILQGVFIGVGISIVWLVAVSALPYIPELGRKPGTDAFYDLERHDDCETIPGLKILRFDGGLFFVNADALADRLRQIRVETPTGLDGVILSMEGVNFIDTEGADVLLTIAQAGIDHDIDLYLARIKPQVVEVLERTASSTSSTAATSMTTSRRRSGTRAVAPPSAER